MTRIRNARSAAVVALASVGFVLFGVTAANASSASDAVDAQFTSLKGDITTVYIPALLALAVLGIGVMLGVKWLRRGANKA